MSRDKNTRTRRWVGNIKNNKLKITNTVYEIDICQFYGNPQLLNNTIVNLDDENDYAIENRKAEIAIRIKQSKFRKNVLENFEERCCITDIEEKDLLVASHIIPWAQRIESRLDPANGICLFILYDHLFDKGYFTIENDLSIIITTRVNSLSSELIRLLTMLKSKKIRRPLRYQLKEEYIRYHRENVYIK